MNERIDGRRLSGDPGDRETKIEKLHALIESVFN